MDAEVGDEHEATVPLLLTVPEAARVLALGRTKVYELIGAGELETVHIGRAVRIPADAVATFVQRRRVAGAGYGAAAASPSSGRPGTR